MTINEVPERVVTEHKTLAASKYDKVVEAFRNMNEGRALSISFDNRNQLLSAYSCIRRRFDKLRLNANMHLRSRQFLLQITKVKK